MRFALWSVVILAFAAVAAAADDKPKPTDELPKTVAELKKKSEDAQREAYTKYEAMTEEEKKDNKKVGELFDSVEKVQFQQYEKAFELAKADPKADAAVEAIDWLLTTPRVYYIPVGTPALVFATEHFADNPKIGRVVLTLGRFGLPEGSDAHTAAAAFLKAVGEKNKDKTVLGQLAMSKAWRAKSKFEVAEYRKQKDADELATLAEKALEATAKEYGDVKLLGRGETQTIGEAAKVELFELRNLRVGKTAPDIEGEDLDGVKFKLSDYKGKVVVVDFWGDW